MVKKNKEFTQTYYHIYNKGLNNLKFNDNEVIEVKWMSPDEIITSITSNPNNWAPSVNGFKKILGYYKILNK